MAPNGGHRGGLKKGELQGVSEQGRDTTRARVESGARLLSGREGPGQGALAGARAERVEGLARRDRARGSPAGGNLGPPAHPPPSCRSGPSQRA